MNGDGSGSEVLDGLHSRVDPSLRRMLARSFELGFLGSMAIEDQIDHALGFVAVLEDRLGAPPRSVLDLGTGGGVPGLVLISCWPETRVVLMDASERRTGFLSETLEGWDGGRNAEVVRGRAEELGRRTEMREQFEAVTSRSFGTPALTAECGSAFLSVDGWMVVSEPPDLPSGLRWPTAGLALVGLEPEGSSRVAGRFGYQVLRKVAALGDRYPRRVGVPAKRPVF
jgi:16S rRNA (guanine527-N7)-methyltransferase